MVNRHDSPFERITAEGLRSLANFSSSPRMTTSGRTSSSSCAPATYFVWRVSSNTEKSTLQYCFWSMCLATLTKIAELFDEAPFVTMDQLGSLERGEYLSESEQSGVYLGTLLTTAVSQSKARLLVMATSEVSRSTV